MMVKMRQARSLLSLAPLHHFRGYQRALGPRLSPGAFLGQRSEEQGLLQCSVLLSQMENTFAKEGKMDFPPNTFSQASGRSFPGQPGLLLPHTFGLNTVAALAPRADFSPQGSLRQGTPCRQPGRVWPLPGWVQEPGDPSLALHKGGGVSRAQLCLSALFSASL